MSASAPPPADVLLTVRRCVADSLALPLDDVAATSRLTDDLGATSLDFIDIIFLVEKELGIRIRDTELAFLTRLDFSSPEVMREGVLTPEVVARLGTFLPALALEADPAAVTPKRLFSLITVEAIALVVERRLVVMADTR
jgi:acyl carrier protein